MSITLRVIVDIFLFIGCFFAFAGTIGILRMPDSFCRMQSSTNIATLGTAGVLIGGTIYEFAIGNCAMAVKILVIAIFIILTNPIGGHAICRAAYRLGVRPDKEMVCDDYGRDKIDE